MFLTISAKSIIDKCSSLKVLESRKVTDEYAEVVFFNQDFREWEKILDESLGEPLKKAFKKPGWEALNITKSLGSIRFDQTLYFKIFDEVIIIAMFWPWQDKEHTTIKIACLKKK